MPFDFELLRTRTMETNSELISHLHDAVRTDVRAGIGVVVGVDEEVSDPGFRAHR